MFVCSCVCWRWLCRCISLLVGHEKVVVVHWSCGVSLVSKLSLIWREY
ncbi:hypothetical protein KC19_11G068800 [Ceratodon purpureus]|uniref:Uncharacterized protein n=1 Tax=Ceratodon purpureus TaxID=3225 RepID=A0A8T0GES6_CERPU|nr:hypothetical protein KC19_11G068800 [Ceratodon purpureus]